MQKHLLSERTERIKLSSIREVAARVEKAARQGLSVTNFAAGRPDVDSPTHVKRATQQAMADGWVHYAKSIGLDALREAVSRRLGQDFGLDIDPDRIIITLGATEAMFVALQSILNPGDEVLVPQPMYVYYEGWISLGDASLVPVPLSARDGFLLKAAHIRPKLSSRTKALIINSPHNPTGQVFEKEDLLEIAALAAERDFYVICDDIYSYLLYDGARHFPLAGARGLESRSIMIGSLSKTYAMDGWRVGYLIGPQAMIDRALKIHQYAVGCANTFVQFGATAALGGPQDFVREMLAELDRRRLFMLSCLDDLAIPYVRPRGAFYVFPDIGKFGMSSKAFSDYLFSEAHVAVVPGEAFGPDGEGHIRMAYCIPFHEVERGMERMRRAIEKL
jgi:aspartate/methionine/tyrosine aminotransferase